MDPMILVVGAFALVMLMVMGSVMASLYKKVGANQAMIVSGGGAKPIVISGGGTVVLPLVQVMQTVSLELMSIDYRNTVPIDTNDGAGLFLEAVIEAHIGRDEAAIMLASQNFGDKDTREIRGIISDTIYDHIRSIINSTSRDKIVNNLSEFSQQVLMSAHGELAKLGIVLQAFRVKNVREVRTSLQIGDTSTSSQQVLQLQQTNHNHNGDIAPGRLAVVSSPISDSVEGEITYELKGGMSRLTRKAKSRLIGISIDIGTPVVITSINSNEVVVEPWSIIHESMPAQ